MGGRSEEEAVPERSGRRSRAAAGHLQRHEGEGLRDQPRGRVARPQVTADELTHDQDCDHRGRVRIMGRAGMIVGRTCGLFAVALALAGCSSIQETAFAPNMVRLDVKPYAAPFVREATLRRAAELTLQNGYSAFRLLPIYTFAFDDFGVTIVMFHVGDPSAYDAFDAAAVLKKYGD